MKKSFLVLLMAFLMCCGSVFAVEEIVSLDDIEEPVKAKVVTTNNVPKLNVNVTFDWLDIDMAKRDEQIETYRKLLFENPESSIYYPTSKEFKTKFAPYYKDKEFKLHYMLTNNGVTEDEDAKYCAFYFKKNVLVMYAIQYKDNPTNAFYYSAFGKLYYTDLMSGEYPNFPYTSMQYDRKGNLKSAIYFISKDFQYMFGPDKEFQGVWYKEKMYDKNGNQKLTRTNW